MYDNTDQRFVSVSHDRLSEIYSSTSEDSLPPLHRVVPVDLTSENGLTLTVYLNKKKPLSEPKWCRTNSADEWLYEQFGSRKAGREGGWKGKLEIVDPDPVRRPPRSHVG